MNIEYGYELGHLETYLVRQYPDEVRRRMWVISMAGGYTTYYYSLTAWDVISHDVIPPGYSYCKHLHSFFTGTRYWEMEPRDDLVNLGHCLANEGKEYIVYLPDGGAVTLNVQTAELPLVARWFDPGSGREIKIDETVNAGTHEFRVPDGFGNSDAVLHLKESSQ